MTTAPSLNSSSETWTSRPAIVPFSSNTLYALNTFDFHLHLKPRLAGLVHRAALVHVDDRDAAAVAVERAAVDALKPRFVWPTMLNADRARAPARADAADPSARAR